MTISCFGAVIPLPQRCESLQAVGRARGHDSVKRATFQDSRQPCAPSLFVSFGNLPVRPGRDSGRAGGEGLLYFTGRCPSYAQTGRNLKASPGQSRARCPGRSVRGNPQRFPLAAADAHRLLESGKTQGATILEP